MANGPPVVDIAPGVKFSRLTEVNKIVLIARARKTLSKDEQKKLRGLLRDIISLAERQFPQGLRIEWLYIRHR